ncbi:MAG: hypothetical protein O3B64_02705 [bacterium]|nr:hypothetical protein [bacterium]
MRKTIFNSAAVVLIIGFGIPWLLSVTFSENFVGTLLALFMFSVVLPLLVSAVMYIDTLKTDRERHRVVYVMELLVISALLVGWFNFVSVPFLHDLRTLYNGNTIVAHEVVIDEVRNSLFSIIVNGQQVYITNDDKSYNAIYLPIQFISGKHYEVRYLPRTRFIVQAKLIEGDVSGDSLDEPQPVR